MVIHHMKNYLLYKDATCLCSLFARPSSIRTLLLSDSVALFSILLDSVLLRVVFVGFLSSLTVSY